MSENGNAAIWLQALPAFCEHEQLLNERRCAQLSDDAQTLPPDFVAAVCQTSMPITSVEDYLDFYKDTKATGSPLAN
jgi:hypothetical protein